MVASGVNQNKVHTLKYIILLYLICLSARSSYNVWPRSSQCNEKLFSGAIMILCRPLAASLKQKCIDFKVLLEYTKQSGLCYYCLLGTNIKCVLYHRWTTGNTLRLYWSSPLSSERSYNLSMINHSIISSFALASAMVHWWQGLLVLRSLSMISGGTLWTLLAEWRALELEGRLRYTSKKYWLGYKICLYFSKKAKS